MLTLLYGSDDFAIGEEVARLRSRLGDPQMASLNLSTVDGSQITPQELQSITAASPFLSENRLVIINGILARFEQKREGGKGKNKSSTEEAANLAAILTRGEGGMLPPWTDVVLVEAAINPSKNLLWTSIGQRGAEQRMFSLPKESDLPAWVMARAKQQGGELLPTAAALLVKAVGQDTRRLASEVDKLLTFASGKHVDEDAVRQLVADVHTAGIFELVDAVLQDREEHAIRLLHRLLDEGTVPQQILVMIVRQFRLALQAKNLMARRASQEDIRSTLGMESDWAIRNVMRQAQDHTSTELQESLEKLLELDRRIKTGRTDAQVGLEVFVAER